MVRVHASSYYRQSAVTRARPPPDPRTIIQDARATTVRSTTAVLTLLGVLAAAFVIIAILWWIKVRRKQITDLETGNIAAQDQSTSTWTSLTHFLLKPFNQAATPSSHLPKSMFLSNFERKKPVEQKPRSIHLRDYMVPDPKCETDPSTLQPAILRGNRRPIEHFTHWRRHHADRAKQTKGVQEITDEISPLNPFHGHKVRKNGNKR